MARLGRSFPRQALIGRRRSTAAGGPADGAATGTGTAVATGLELAAGAGAAAGVGSAAGIGQALSAAAGAAAAAGSALGVGAILAIGIGSAVATSSASGAGQIAPAAGAAAGSGSAVGVGQATAQAAGTAAGTSTAAGVGVALSPGVGTAAGSSAAAGVGISATFAVGVGTAFASSTAAGAGRRAAVGIGTAFGVSDAAAIGERFQLPPPLTYPFAVPREFCPRSLTMAARNTSMTNESPTTGQQLVGSTTFERWEWEVELPVMLAEDGEPVAAFLESLRGMRGAFEFGNPKKRRARGSARQGDNPIVEGSTSREIYINATSILGNRKRWLAAGDMISIGQSGSITRRLYRVLRDVDLAFGHGVADVWPALRIVPLIPGDTVFVENPSTIFRLAHQSIEHEVDVEGWYHFPRFAIVQWINAQDETPDNVRGTTGQAQGESNVAGVGLMIVRGTGAAFGSSTVSGIITGSIGAAQATSTAAGIGTKIARGTGAAAGIGSAGGVGRTGSVGAAAGVGSAAGVGIKLFRGIGAAAGVGSAAGVGQTGEIHVGTGAAVGTSTVSGAGSSSGGTGNIVADATLLTLSVDGLAWAPSGGGPTTTWSPTNKNSHVVLSGGNLVSTVSTGPTGDWYAGRTDTGITAGQKRYIELTLTAGSVPNEMGVGIMTAAHSLADHRYVGDDTESVAVYGDGSLVYNATVVASVETATAGDVIGIAIDAGNKIWVRKNGGLWMNNGTANPVTNTGGFALTGNLTGTVYPAYNHYYTSGPSVWTANFAGPFAFTAPSGFTGM